MKKLFSVLTALMFVAFAANISAQTIKLSGDLQVRPRYDMKNYGDYGGVKNDMYYMLRARLNIKADIGDGWYGKVQLGHYNYAGYTFTNGAEMAQPFYKNPVVNFTQAYFGYNSGGFDIHGGIIPLNGLKNPMIDIHYYPNKMVDIPFTIMELNNAIGFAGYIAAGPGKINYHAVLEDNGWYQEDASGNVTNDTHDTYSFGLDYDFEVGGFQIQPVFMFTWANDSVAAPMTYGLNLATPKFGGFRVGLSAGMTSNNATGTTEYSGMLVRVKLTGKLGPGSVIAWYDYAKRTNKYDTGDVDENYGYIWLAYKYGIGKHVLVMPRVRILSDKIDGSKDFSRTKAEILFIAKF